MAASRKVREAMACYQNSEDLIQLGAYAAGSNPKLDRSIRTRENVLNFLRQNADEKAKLPETLNSLSSIAAAVAS
jgi:flagellar biosynthesis/type III secretory pathway ATPase